MNKGSVASLSIHFPMLIYHIYCVYLSDGLCKVDRCRVYVDLFFPTDKNIDMLVVLLWKNKLYGRVSLITYSYSVLLSLDNGTNGSLVLT